MKQTNYKIIYEKEAIEDLEEIAFYFASIEREDLQESIIRRIEASIQTLDYMPERNPLCDFSDKVRRLVVTNLPYLVFYRVKACNVHILNVLHGKRSQNFLQEKYQDL